MLPMVNAAVPVFVIVTDCDPLHVPTVVVPNERLVAESVTGVGVGAPVPLNAMVCGDPAALPVMVTAAVFAPADVGWKCP